MAQRQAKKVEDKEGKDLEVDQNSEKNNDQEIAIPTPEEDKSIKKDDKDVLENTEEVSAAETGIETQDMKDQDEIQDEQLQEKKSKPKPLKGGLQTAEEIRLENKEKEKKIREELKKLKAEGKLSNNPTLTQARKRPGDKHDDSDKKKMKKEKSQSKTVDEAKLAREKEMREKLLKMKNEGINVYENDQKRVESKKKEIKSEDPALLFDKNTIEKHKVATKSEFVSITGRKLYPDVSRYPINRFGIAPGWRWDGIIRGNGFEQKWLDAHPEHKIPSKKNS